MIIYNDCSMKLSNRKNLNIIKIEGIEYQLKYLNDKLESNKGGNSNVFLLYDPHNDIGNQVIKFCKSNLYTNAKSNRVKRFIREIASLKRARKSNLNKVISIISYGKLVLEDEKSKLKYRFYYHITEKAENDLTDFIKSGSSKYDTVSKVLLCKDLISSLKQLHSINVYHRDIKPENILFFQDGSWKICDLGLVEFRDVDVSMDKPNDMIGPRGWLSPEASNKHYAFCKDHQNNSLCLIDEKSDLFQLGKIFWFIFQGNVPIGVVTRADFLIDDDRIYAFLMWMLRHNKTRRISMAQLEIEYKNTLKSKYKIN